MSLSPSKLQTRSTGQVLTSRNSHSMRFPVTAIIKSASFSEINVKRVYVCSLPQTMGVALCYVVFLFQAKSALFSKINTCRGMAKETLKKIVSPEGKNILTFTMCLGVGDFSLMKKPLYSEWLLYFNFLKITIKIAKATAIKKNTESTFG